MLLLPSTEGPLSSFMDPASGEAGLIRRQTSHFRSVPEGSLKATSCRDSQRPFPSLVSLVVSMSTSGFVRDVIVAALLEKLGLSAKERKKKRKKRSGRSQRGATSSPVTQKNADAVSSLPRNDRLLRLHSSIHTSLIFITFAKCPHTLSLHPSHTAHTRNYGSSPLYLP